MQFIRNRLALTGLAMIAILTLLAILSPALSRFGIIPQPFLQSQGGLDEDGMPLGPCKSHWLGTDSLGRDVLSRVLHGTRVSLTVGVAGMFAAAVLGLAIGVASGFYGGKADILLMRFTEMNMALPAILLAVALAGVMDGRVLHLHPWAHSWHWMDLELKRGIASLIFIIGFVCWPGMVRVIRGQVLTLREREFITASRALGASNVRLIFAHILPNIAPTAIVLSVMTTANTILLEAGLGYLGIGVLPPAPTWGSMINDGQPYFITAPHVVVVPGVAIVLTVLAFNLLGLGLQEIIDPKRAR